MKSPTLVFAIALAILTEAVCIADTLEWGKSVNGIRMSISASNSVVAIGETLQLECHITNSSDGVMYIVEVNPKSDFSIFLIDRSENSRRISPDRDPHSPIFARSAREIQSGHGFACTVTAEIPRAIKPGHYSLKAIRQFLIPGGRTLELTSNTIPLDVVEKPTGH